MVEQILRRILPYRIVRRDDYMVRFFILGSRGEGDGRWGVRLHHIISSDDDSFYHNHPYNFTSFILWGGYTEHQPGMLSKRFRIGQRNRMSIDDYHRLELKKPAWTLVFTGPRQAEWGFWSGKSEDRFISWREHNVSPQ